MGKIKGSEIIENNLFDNAAKSGKAFVEVLKTVEKELKDISKAQNKIAQTTGTKDFKSLQAKTKAINEVKTATDGLTRVQKSLKRAQEDLAVSRSKEARDLVKTRQALNDVRKSQRGSNKAIKESGDAYKTLSTQTNKAQANFKRLAAQFGVTSKQARRAKREFETLDNKLRKVNDAARDGRRDVGRYSTAFKGLGGVLKRGLGVLGLVTGISLIARGIKNTISIISGFQQSASNLASVLGKTRGEIKALTNDAKRLGSSTKFTAQQVTALQTEFAKLGFSEKEIISATEATLDLAAATGTDLAEAAAIAGATLGGFGLEADETQRIVDVMAKSFSKSALDMEKFKESMKTAAPAAKAVGVSVEKTTALLGTMANAGIFGSRAGNALKNTFIELNKKGLTLAQGLDKVKNSENKLGTATKLVGKIAATSFLVLAEGTETTKELTTELQNAGGAAKEMADTQLDTLTGATTRMSSAWEGFILSLEDGDGVIAKVLRGAIDLATEFLEVLTNLSLTNGQILKKGLASRQAKGQANAEIIIQERIVDLQKEGNEELRKIIDKDDKRRKWAIEIIKLRNEGIKGLENELIITAKQFTIEEKHQKKTEKFIQERIKLGYQGAVTDEEIAKFRQRAGFTEAFRLHTQKLLTGAATEELEIILASQHAKASTNELIREELRRRQDIGEVEEKTGKTVDETSEKRSAAQKKAITGLEKLRKELSEINKERSDILVDKGGVQDLQFDQLTAQAEKLNDQIKAYEEILRLSKEIAGDGVEFDPVFIDGTDDEDSDWVDLVAENNADLKKLGEDRVKDQKENTAKLLDVTTQGLTMLNNIVQKKSQQRVEALDREIQASQSAQDVLRAIAQNGIADSEENLAFEQQKQAELEQRKQKEIERAANLELVLSAVSTFNAQVQAGATPAEALGSTAVTMTALEALVNGLDLFYEGTENTGTAANPLDSNGGRLAVLHDNERVITSAQNDVIGNMTNWELANMAGDYKDGSLTMQNASLTQPFLGGQEMLNRLDSIESAIVNKPTLTDIKYNELERAMVYTVESRNKTERNHVKTGGIW